MTNSQVLHAKYGQGAVLLDQGTTLVIRFSHGIEEVLAAEVRKCLSPDGALAAGAYASPVEALARVQAAAIRSLNDSWGVFSRSRITLLPHQLWVCHQAIRQWPTRLLIADDVGLGKTVEAGLMLWPLLSRGMIRRLLVLTPASLVEQWQYRMRQLFDIRLSIYRPELDSGKADFWSIHQQVVASLPTLRANRNGRHERLLDAPGWDMVIVDEAHHLHVTEEGGKTLGFELIEKMQAMGKIDSCALFTGTPHRGKSYGFWSLMSLVDNRVFGPKKSESQMLEHLPRYLIRNCKQKIVDMQGQRIFKPIIQSPEIFSYTLEEEAFYRKMSAFIESGKTYASSLSQQGRGQVMLVLFALQKLASSSVAAVRSALRARLARIRNSAASMRSESYETGTDENDDEAGTMLRRWVESERNQTLLLMDNEVVHLEQLLNSAEAVCVESRVNRVIEIVENRFANQSVLLFTEYKATQALIVSALMMRFGESSVGFINGESRLNDVRIPDGRIQSLTSSRENMAEKFNAGEFRFLISTEAGGEGIDLQQHCHCLIHVDLPWNPMRLHQRVGRLNRFGQKEQVHVVSLRNPDTVEAHIWNTLEEKLGAIMKALGSVMDEPEDLLQLVLGMTDQTLFNSLFTEGRDIPRDRFDQWFDEKTRTFGGREAIDTVKNLVGHAQSFDLSGLESVPKVDLPDLEPFFLAMLRYNKRRPIANPDELGLSFSTPDAWRTTPAISRKYENMVFDRQVQGKDASGRILGVGHPLMDRALHQAMDFTSNLAVLPDLQKTLFLFEVFDRVTSGGGQIRRVLVGVETQKGEPFRLVRDEEILKTLNLSQSNPHSHAIPKALKNDCAPVSEVKNWLAGKLAGMGLPFLRPDIACYSILLALEQVPII
jgi:hypothetical protein